MEVCVFGAGLAGLSAGYELSGNGVSVSFLEKDSQVGGLAKSFTADGFTYDLGPHRFHTKEDYLIEHLKNLLGDNLVLEERKSRIFLQGRFFDYPLKVGNAMFSMPPATTARILADYLKIKLRNLSNPQPDDSFESWVVNRFGRKLYMLFFGEYTEKTWGIPCTSISADWAAQRISLLSLWDTLVNTVVPGKDKPRTYASEFYYPRQGGIGAIAKAYEKAILAAKGAINLNTSIKQISLNGNRFGSVIFTSGGKTQTKEFDHFFSTISLTTLVSLIKPEPPKTILGAAEKLRFRSIVFVYLVINRGKVFDEHWIYLPEKKFTSNRIAETKNFSSQNAPERKTILCFEVTCFKGDEKWNLSDEELKERVIGDLMRISDVRKDEVLSCFTQRMEHTYPLYTLDYLTHLERIRAFLDGIENLSYFGRNALFRYNNMDYSMDTGIKAAKNMIGQKTDYKKVASGQEWFG
ncbi:MAG: FAD-dependent oxidoreductase [Candidatus Altiarchaeota archaeon]